MATQTEQFVKVGQLQEIKAAKCPVVYAEGHAIAIVSHNGTLHAIDNRCPHMGFPLDKGTVKEGILTCHWHHARFDVVSGGTFDLWADDVPTFPVEVRGDEVWVDLAPSNHSEAHHEKRLKDGLQQQISLVIAKSVIALLGQGSDATAPFRLGLEFGTHYRRAGWGAGLTILTCMHNLRPYLKSEDHPQALYHGLSAVARDCANEPPHFNVEPLPSTPADIETLKGWFCQFVEVRDSQGAERCLMTAIQASASPIQIADILFTAATDHRFIDGGHTLDFTNKALEALDIAGWQHAAPVLGSLVRGYTEGERKEESNAWRSPIDLVDILNQTFQALPDAISQGTTQLSAELDQDRLVAVVLGDDPALICTTLLDQIRAGCSVTDLAAMVAYAAALRIAHFHTQNDFRDWDTAHHSFTFANAVYKGLQRVSSPELTRGIFDAAMTIYLNRFLNIPAAPLPKPENELQNPEQLLDQLPELLDRQQQVNEVGNLVARYLYGGGDGDRLLAVLGRLMLREDRSFHTIQELDAAFNLYTHWQHKPDRVYILVAAARYLAAHAPTTRAQHQTYQIAARLHRGEHLFESST
ncbi:3-phenylpropionate/cinnamic acid dioxygenase ferredoxin subunit [Acaryochloris thomasi RCC1774]|uniref:3-phenylpropionate/cinnamic acid dioxygenase ferredoxin subunit n=1 Tax=Acaryochloris thomasi RCC1774 TaxID=1764569 RepID=A0A2W1JG79_9CYAN|nr:Rieske 2Fe-2S domain-containing protein [Acaryochloris thomasi]PZD70645.1 3-phenylpropionate/cinnamic acid dioxygenase ferredoxin subunit [Acaryochloris thomasi RCC1774]